MSILPPYLAKSCGLLAKLDTEWVRTTNPASHALGTLTAAVVKFKIAITVRQGNTPALDVVPVSLVLQVTTIRDLLVGATAVDREVTPAVQEVPAAPTVRRTSIQHVTVQQAAQIVLRGSIPDPQPSPASLVLLENTGVQREKDARYVPTTLTTIRRAFYIVCKTWATKVYVGKVGPLYRFLIYL
jgi:hypothetical protein